MAEVTDLPTNIFLWFPIEKHGLNYMTADNTHLLRKKYKSLS